MLGRHIYRVSPTPNGGWSVTKEGESAPRDARQTRDGAVAFACALAAADEPSRVVVDNADGTLAEERIFGADPVSDAVR